jgi:hypothetical protein
VRDRPTSTTTWAPAGDQHSFEDLDVVIARCTRLIAWRLSRFDRRFSAAEVLAGVRGGVGESPDVPREGRRGPPLSVSAGCTVGTKRSLCARSTGLSGGAAGYNRWPLVCPHHSRGPGRASGGWSERGSLPSLFAWTCVDIASRHRGSRWRLAGRGRLRVDLFTPSARPRRAEPGVPSLRSPCSHHRTRCDSDVDPDGAGEGEGGLCRALSPPPESCPSPAAAPEALRAGRPARAPSAGRRGPGRELAEPKRAHKSLHRPSPTSRSATPCFPTTGPDLRPQVPTPSPSRSRVIPRPTGRSAAPGGAFLPVPALGPVQAPLRKHP